MSENTKEDIKKAGQQHPGSCVVVSFVAQFIQIRWMRVLLRYYLLVSFAIHPSKSAVERKHVQFSFDESAR